MSYQLMAWAAEQKTGSPTRKSVLLALANAANHHTGRCHPRIERLAEETECSEKTVRRALLDLVAAGLISRTRSRRQDGTLGTYQYTLNGTASPPPPVTDTASPPVTVTAQNQEVHNQEEDLLPTASAPRPRNQIWDTLTDIFGEAETRTAQTLRGRVCRSLADARASPDEIIVRAKRWPLHFDGATLTETALEKHWTTLGRKPLRRQP